MNGVDDNFEPATGGPRERTRRLLAGAARLCMGASLLSLPMAVVDPNGWWLTGSVAGAVLYLLLTHFSLMDGEDGVP